MYERRFSVSYDATLQAPLNISARDSPLEISKRDTASRKQQAVRVRRMEFLNLHSS